MTEVTARFLFSKHISGAIMLFSFLVKNLYLPRDILISFITGANNEKVIYTGLGILISSNNHGAGCDEYFLPTL